MRCFKRRVFKMRSCGACYGLGGPSRKRCSRKHDAIPFHTEGTRVRRSATSPRCPRHRKKMKGKPKGATDVRDIPALDNMSKERTGHGRSCGCGMGAVEGFPGLPANPDTPLAKAFGIARAHRCRFERSRRYGARSFLRLRHDPRGLRILVGNRSSDRRPPARRPSISTSPAAEKSI